MERSAPTPKDSSPRFSDQPIRFFVIAAASPFFDYRSACPKQIEDAIGKCSPYNLPSADPELLHAPNIAFLFLSRAAYDRLIPWTRWEEEKPYSEKVVPCVEAGYPDPVPITLIEKILRVNIDYPRDSIAAILHRARLRQAGIPPSTRSLSGEE